MAFWGTGKSAALHGSATDGDGVWLFIIVMIETRVQTSTYE